ncbi:MAG: helix-turn-helix transcriptional regulator [Oscillospiraceae bacterium]|nr:helix-turn-helix transcriptional regulator [Oscillospiraceae bacterium]
MKQIDYKLVGQKVKQMRNKNNYTQEMMAEMCDISTSYLGHIERGSRKLTLETALKIATCLHISLDALVIDGLGQSESLVFNLQAVLDKKDKEKQNQLIRIIKVLIQHIDEL